MQESNGVLSHLNWLSLAQSLRRSGIPTFPTPQTNLYCGWECFLRACFNLLPQIVRISDLGGYDAYSLVGDATLVPARKYFTVSAYTVSTSRICAHIWLHLTPEVRHACTKIGIPRRAWSRAYQTCRGCLRATRLRRRLLRIVSSIPRSQSRMY